MGENVQSATTHVANSYNQTIYVNVSTDRVAFSVITGLYDNRNGECKKGHTGIIRNPETYSKVGFTPIKTGSFLGFDTGPMKQTIYVTILKDCGCSVSENYPIKSDYSVIVDEEGYLVETQYGSLFRDRNGEAHHGFEQYY